MKEMGLCFRLIWLVLYLAALGCFIANLVNGVQKYRQHGVVTVLDYRTQVLMEFPSVTICNTNMIRKSYYKQHQNDLIGKVVDFYDPFVAQPLNTTDPTTRQQLANLHMVNIAREGAHQIDMFRNCSFMSNHFNCHNDEVLVQTMTQMGVCYTFQSKQYVEKHGQLSTLRAGDKGGLHLIMDIQQYDYKVANLGDFTAGLKVRMT